MRRLGGASIFPAYFGVTVVILLAFGCTPKFSKDNDIYCAYQGRNINEVKIKWGDPIKSFAQADGGKVYVYYYADVKRSNAMGQAGSLGGLAGIAGFGSMAAEGYIKSIDYCTAFLELNREGLVTGCRFEGTACE